MFRWTNGGLCGRWQNSRDEAIEEAIGKGVASRRGNSLTMHFGTRIEESPGAVLNGAAAMQLHADL